MRLCRYNDNKLGVVDTDWIYAVGIDPTVMSGTSVTK